MLLLLEINQTTWANKKTKINKYHLFCRVPSSQEVFWNFSWIFIIAMDKKHSTNIMIQLHCLGWRKFKIFKFWRIFNEFDQNIWCENKSFWGGSVVSVIMFRTNRMRKLIMTLVFAVVDQWENALHLRPFSFYWL